jgi:SRSO17 transposase
MDVVEADRLRDELAEFGSEVFASLTRSGWQDRATAYLQGLMIDGRRKSIQPMAAPLQGVHEQALNHFVINSPWQAPWQVSTTQVRHRIAVRGRQYTGTAGKVTNCQIAVSVSMVTDTASCPVDWRLFMPESWDPASPKATSDVHDRRRAAGISDDVR